MRISPKPWFFLFLVVALCGMVGRATHAQPNILIIFTDDQGYRDVGCYGAEFPTPHIDRLAKEGMKFTNFYSASAICTPSRYGLLTGKNPSRSRDRLLSALMFHDEGHRKLGIQSSETTLPSLLQANGYQTALIGKWHLGHGDPAFSPLQHGFGYWYGHSAGCVDYFTLDYGITPDWYRNDQRLKETGYATELISSDAVRYLQRRDTKKPFFLFLAYNAPHFGKGWDDGNDREINLLQPHPDALQRVNFIEEPGRKKYAAMVTSLDDGVGAVLNYLDESGLSDNTLVIFMSDHGGDPNYGGLNAPLRAGKATLFEGGIKVPCLVRWPGKVKVGSEHTGLAWSLDWFPTLSAVAGIAVGNNVLDGVNIEKALRGGDGSSERDMFWELGSHQELERGHWLAFRSGQWKYVNAPEKGEFLFNVGLDPNETQDVKGRSPEIFSRMRRKCMELAAGYKEYAGHGR